MVLISLSGKVELAVGEVVVGVSSMETADSIGGADSSLFEAHVAESAS